MTVHKTTGITPNTAMLGREVMLPAALIARPPEETTRTSVPFVRGLRDALRDAHDKVRVATQATARTQKRYYDGRSKQTPFQQGQLVWLYWPRPPHRQKFKKLQKLWTGPWKIEHFKTPLVVLIKHTLKNTRQTVHVDRLLPCNSLSEAETGTPPTLTSQQTDRQLQTAARNFPRTPTRTVGPARSPSLSRSRSDPSVCDGVLQLWHHIFWVKNLHVTFFRSYCETALLKREIFHFSALKIGIFCIRT